MQSTATCRKRIARGLVRRGGEVPHSPTTYGSAEATAGVPEWAHTAVFHKPVPTGEELLRRRPVAHRFSCMHEGEIGAVDAPKSTEDTARCTWLPLG